MSRVDRLAEEMRQQISIIIQRDLSDPRIGFVTITRVDLSPDLRSAKVYFTALEKDKTFNDTLKGLEKASGFVRKIIGERIRIKFIPTIRFIYDNMEQARSRIDDIIDIIHQEKGTDNGGQ